MARKSSAIPIDCSKALKTLTKPIATLLLKLLQPEAELGMRDDARHAMSLHGLGGRKYLNAAERKRFLTALRHAPPRIRLFCLALMWSGCRVSELLALTPFAIDLDTGLATFETLKRRRRGVMRQVPLPPSLLSELERTFDLKGLQSDYKRAHERLWPWNRATAWRRVKAIMRAAGITGSQATPKGLRHTFGVAAFQASVPPHIVQRWLGHASLRTTAIYGDVSGDEEREFAARMWRNQ